MFSPSHGSDIVGLIPIVSCGTVPRLFWLRRAAFGSTSEPPLLSHPKRTASLLVAEGASEGPARRIFPRTWMQQLVDLGLQLEPSLDKCLGVQLETSAIMAAWLCRLDRSCTSAIFSFDQFNGLLLRV